MDLTILLSITEMVTVSCCCSTLSHYKTEIREAVLHALLFNNIKRERFTVKDLELCQLALVYRNIVLWNETPEDSQQFLLSALHFMIFPHLVLLEIYFFLSPHIFRKSSNVSISFSRLIFLFVIISFFVVFCSNMHFFCINIDCYLALYMILLCKPILSRRHFVLFLHFHEMLLLYYLFVVLLLFLISLFYNFIFVNYLLLCFAVTVSIFSSH